MAASNTETIIIPGEAKNMSLKIGRSAAELSKPCYTAGSSRVSRSRAAKALELRNKRKVVRPQSPPSPNQESAVNSRTGKVAFGPWQGPYETYTDTGVVGPLFLDPSGNTYASLTTPGSPSYLEGVVLPKVQLQQAKAVQQPAAGPTKEQAAAATKQLLALVGKMSQCRSATVAQGRMPSLWPGSGKARNSGRCGNIMARSINQPRRS
ncbi:hypothetical protein Vretimale_7485 [Volvox reticuliferus]|uniref:Uncharacterized protein n=1 Tax=Volvox reticuliferus TaxID=1737510 RepID=A0A8J4CAU1_9CHLO|nr:hypothetical protein Vretifemale_7519 [Volvox reticuliferus]GIM02604.1 hypothetical protein Vretimale_7485 [Volvox reticuliferus]